MARLVYGVGVNDSNYLVEVRKRESGKNKVVWFCPLFRKWKDMLKRCYSEKFLETKPTYRGCTVCDEWLTFSNFKSWLELQDWEGKQLDKDLLVPGNKVYSPETCCLITPQLNTFLAFRCTGVFESGVSYYKRVGKYIAQISFGGKMKGLGYFDCEQEAHKAWLSAKLEHGLNLIKNKTDARITDEVIKEVLRPNTVENVSTRKENRNENR